MTSFPYSSLVDFRSLLFPYDFLSFLLPYWLPFLPDPLLTSFPSCSLVNILSFLLPCWLPFLPALLLTSFPSCSFNDCPSFLQFAPCCSTYSPSFLLFPLLSSIHSFPFLTVPIGLPAALFPYLPMFSVQTEMFETEKKDFYWNIWRFFWKGSPSFYPPPPFGVRSSFPW